MSKTRTLFSGPNRIRFTASLLALSIAALAILSGCASQPPKESQATEVIQSESGSDPARVIDDEAENADSRQQFSTDKLNRRLSEVSVKNTSVLTDYQIGAGDILELAVFQVAELSRRVRVNGRGKIMLPLLGEIQASGKSAAELEAELAQLLGEKYLQNPQVSVFVSEYRSQQITVIGAVNQPSVHNVQRPHTLLEILSMSGGLTTEASKQIHVKTTRYDDEGKLIQESFVIDLIRAIDSGQASANMVLHSGDTVFVPQAGVVFVEGYVTKPGAYPMSGTVNVLKAVALAGGLLDVADQESVQVLRQDPGGKTEVIEVDLQSIRASVTTDISLEDGDIVVVQADGVKKTWSGFWRGVTGIFGFSKGL